MLSGEIVMLENSVRAFARDSLPALADGRAVMAVSGGADSIATAALLCEAGIVEPARCVVAHFDHGLRGDAAAAADLGAVHALSARYGVRVVAGSWREPRRGEGAARDARYAFLCETAESADVGVIVTGHTRDDQAETVLMHAMRGAGLHGLSGMCPQVGAGTRDAGGATLVVRPMLCVSRSETRAYCEARGLLFIDDETNTDTSLLRNRVRLELLPRIELAAPGAREALLRLAEESRDAARAMDVMVAPAIVQAGRREVVLSRRALGALPAEARPFAYRLAIMQLVGGARNIERRHYARLPDPVLARTGAVYELPRGLVLTVDPGAFVVSLGRPAVRAIDPMFSASLPFAGEVGEWRLSVERLAGAGGVGLAGEAVVRGRRPGDRMRVRGGMRKLQDVFVDRKVPRRLRDAVPLVATGGEVLWTPFDAGGLAGTGVAGEFVVVAERLSSGEVA